jgi:hypothetical protein
LPDEELHAVLLAGGENAIATRDVEGERFLAEDVLAGLGCGNGRIDVLVWWKAKVDAIEVR